MLAGMDAIGGFVGTTSTSGGTGGSFAVSVDETYLSKSGGSRGSPRTLTTAPATVTPSGGAGGYTHSWTRIGGDAAITAVSSSAASTAFTATLNPGDHFEAQFIDTVHDASGAALSCDTVTIVMDLEDLSGVGGSL